MKNKVIIIITIVSCICITGVGLYVNNQNKKDVDFTGVDSICELTTLQCYYHNIARAETPASGLFKIFGVGYKKMWTEYDGIVQLGIDANKVTIDKPDRNNVVRITIPDAEVKTVDLDENSMSVPLTDVGFMTWITKEEETKALALAQKDMEETAKENKSLLNQAKERAKNILEAYVKNVGEQMGEEYTVEWIDYKE